MTDQTKPRPVAQPSTDAITPDVGLEEVQQRFDAEQKQGFVGVEVDPTPNENYTAKGVTSGAPTPETDDDAAAEARKARGNR